MVVLIKKHISRLKLESNKATFLIGGLCFLSLVLLMFLLIVSWAYWGLLLENQELKASVLNLTDTVDLLRKKISLLEDLLRKNAQSSHNLLREGIVPFLSSALKLGLTVFCGSASAPYLHLVDTGFLFVSKFFFSPAGFKTTLLNNISLLRSTGLQVVGSSDLSPAQNALEILTLSF